MKKYSQTTIIKLKPGDQFVKPDDRKEIHFTFLGFNKGKYLAKKDGLMMPDIIEPDEKIIFLRHSEYEICQVFGCGRQLSLIEKLAGDKCTACMESKGRN